VDSDRRKDGCKDSDGLYAPRLRAFEKQNARETINLLYEGFFFMSIRNFDFFEKCVKKRGISQHTPLQ
jgi:hypothetical protein